MLISSHPHPAVPLAPGNYTNCFLYTLDIGISMESYNMYGLLCSFSQIFEAYPCCRHAQHYLFCYLIIFHYTTDYILMTIHLSVGIWVTTWAIVNHETVNIHLYVFVCKHAF